MTPVNFNPRPREGSDHPGRGAALDAAGFQSTPPRGERLGGRFLGATLAYYFNPRPREGSDGSKLTKVLHPSDFNPRPARGATFIRNICSGIGSISIHAPAMGATANITYFFYSRVPFLINIHKFQYFLTIQI